MWLEAANNMIMGELTKRCLHYPKCSSLAVWSGFLECAMLVANLASSLQQHFFLSPHPQTASNHWPQQRWPPRPPGSNQGTGSESKGTFHHLFLFLIASNIWLITSNLRRKIFRILEVLKVLLRAANVPTEPRRQIEWWNLEREASWRVVRWVEQGGCWFPTWSASFPSLWGYSSRGGRRQNQVWEMWAGLWLKTRKWEGRRKNVKMGKLKKKNNTSGREWKETFAGKR